MAIVAPLLTGGGRPPPSSAPRNVENAIARNEIARNEIGREEAGTVATPKKKTSSKSETSSTKSETSSTKAKPSKTKSAEGKGEKTEKKAEKAPKVEEKKPERPPIDPELLESIKVELLKKKQELGSNVNQELDDMREAAEGHHLADMDDLGGDAHDEETQYKIMEIESAELGQIDLALERMVTGTFGYCETCEKPINVERLRALPFANLCIDCKRLQELNDR